MKRWCGVMLASAGDEPTDDTVALCQSTAYAMIQGHKPVGALA